MHRWLRRFLTILTIGGGFLGIVVGVPRSLFAAGWDARSLVEALVFVSIYLYAIYLGLRLAEGYAPTWGLILYFGLQVPSLDCSAFSYHFYSGLMVTYILGDAGQRFALATGYFQQFLISSGVAASFGVNFIALLMVFMLIALDFHMSNSVVEGLTRR